MNKEELIDELSRFISEGIREYLRYDDFDSTSFTREGPGQVTLNRILEWISHK
jgi:hypothetical protein